MANSTSVQCDDSISTGSEHPFYLMISAFRYFNSGTVAIQDVQFCGQTGFVLGAKLDSLGELMNRVFMDGFG
jgi:hypothetical protein